MKYYILICTLTYIRSKKKLKDYYKIKNIILIGKFILNAIGRCLQLLALIKYFLIFNVKLKNVISKTRRFLT